MITNPHQRNRSSANRPENEHMSAVLRLRLRNGTAEYGLKLSRPGFSKCPGETMEHEYEFTVLEMPGELCVAAGTAADLEDCKAEAMHYAMQYMDDGAIVVEIHKVQRELIERHELP